MTLDLPWQNSQQLSPWAMNCKSGFEIEYLWNWTFKTSFKYRCTLLPLRYLCSSYFRMTETLQVWKRQINDMQQIVLHIQVSLQMYAISVLYTMHFLFTNTRHFWGIYHLIWPRLSLLIWFGFSGIWLRSFYLQNYFLYTFIDVFSFFLRTKFLKHLFNFYMETWKVI